MRRIARLLYRLSPPARITVPLWRRRQFCTNAPSTSGISEAAKYEKKSPTEHVLLRPDTYIGGVGTRENHPCWTLTDTENTPENSSTTMHLREVTYPPGLLKIFDEILVNAADNKARDPTMNRLEVQLDPKTARISVWNNGKGLPVEMHPSENMWVPTLVFGNLFTSSNYDDSEIKTVGGRNGYGAKLCNIFSKEFHVETVDTRRGRVFKQRWFNNMQSCDEPMVTDIASGENLQDFTKVEFVPDLARFHVDHLTDDVICLIKKRVCEVTATAPRGIDVFFNGHRIPVDNFEDYVKAFNTSENDSNEHQILFLHPTPRWHVGVARRIALEGAEMLPKVVSFVNNINTEKGGTHVDYVMEKLVAILKREIDKLLEKSKKSVKPALIRQNVSIFINSLIENPSFESQTKETLTTKPKTFGSVFECDAKKVTQWAESTGLIDDIVEQVLNIKPKKMSASPKNTSVSVRDIVKLEDAAWAGLPGKSKSCTLILTEGDSAKALALAGLEVLSRETFGVFPLKGKLINVSNLDDVKASQNEEIANLMRILGLSFDQPQIALENLRYGKLMILADQDDDGSHIKGLVINFLHRFWPGLLQNQESFVQSFRTPLLKAQRGEDVKSFFSITEYQKWAETVENLEKWKIKYYKGLGTSTSNEARQYFRDFGKHVVNFQYKDASDDEAIRMAFDREKTEERKSWIQSLGTLNGSNELAEEKQQMSYKEFVDGELMQFGMADLRRSIPSLIDGLKPSQRKILWTLFKMDESKEMKVSQLAGAVAHSQSYHHGEESLVRTIVRMGQNFCGAANLPLLQSIGQFGTRHEGGSDAASARYIYTALA
uniref:DNA topoisomerase 2 n=2 Tax=Caenorhabditis japonica TaxID=281687 RepID=A0A8R1HV81_CAEJA